MFLKFVIVGCLLVSPIGCSASENPAAPGFMQGHLHIVSLKPVEPADGDVPPVTAKNFAEYPLMVLSQDSKKEIARIIADDNGNYRLALPPGTYVLDVQDRIRKHLRAKPKPFTVVSDQTVRVDMDLDTGVR